MIVHAAEEVGMSSERLETINAYLEREVAGDRLPGISALVQRRGKVVHHSVHGKMDIEADRAMEADAIFRIYSMTKPVVSLALMLLHDEGRCQLLDPVARYIPAFAKTKVFSHLSDQQPHYVEQDPPMTVFHLLTHTAGLTYGGDAWRPVDQMFRESAEAHGFFRRDLPLADLIAHIAELPLIYQPGADWEYSVATDVLGYLVQAIADMPLDDFLKARIFAPLGMDDTDFYVPPEKTGRLAAIYQAQGQCGPIRFEAGDELLGDVRVPTDCPSGGGGLVSTMADYLRFASMLLNGGVLDGARVTSPMTIKRMTANAIPPSMMPLRLGVERFGYGFGLGFRVMLHPGLANGYSSFGEYGWSGMASTHFVIDPAEDLITLMMTQLVPNEQHRPRSIFPNLAYQAIDELNAG